MVVKGGGELEGVERMDQVEQLDGELALVRLEMTDQVPFDGDRTQEGDFFSGFLDAILPEQLDPGLNPLSDDGNRHRFRDGHQFHIVRVSTDTTSRLGNPPPDLIDPLSDPFPHGGLSPTRAILTHLSLGR